MWLGPERMRRDIGNIQAELVASGRARWLEPGAAGAAAQALTAASIAPKQPPGSLAARELTATVAAVRRLVTVR